VQVWFQKCDPMTPNLSPRTQQLVERFFGSDERAEAARWLVDECGNNLPFCEKSDAYQLERIRFAVLRLGLGDPDEMQNAIDLAKHDWRDVLVWSGFGSDVTAHIQWAERTLKGKHKAIVVVVMGVSGSGKTRVGSLLANTLNWMFRDADNFHSKENIDKMAKGIPLTDEDRAEWLTKLQVLIGRFIEKNEDLILACSALKESYRQILRVDESVRFVYLRGSYEQIEARMRERPGHYMKPEMLKSQFEILEEPDDALMVDISQTPEEIVKLIHNAWNL
jgi:gluconokinase